MALRKTLPQTEAATSSNPWGLTGKTEWSLNSIDMIITLATYYIGHLQSAPLIRAFVIIIHYDKARLFIDPRN